MIKICLSLEFTVVLLYVYYVEFFSILISIYYILLLNARNNIKKNTKNILLKYTEDTVIKR